MTDEKKRDLVRVKPITMSLATRMLHAKTMEEADRLLDSTPAGANTKTRRRIEAAYNAVKNRLKSSQPILEQMSQKVTEDIQKQEDEKFLEQEPKAS